MNTRMMTPVLLGLVAEYFKVLSDPLRLRILNSLRDGERSVGEIVREVDSSQPNVSKHLYVLMKNGFVTRRAEKNTVYYSIADACLWPLCEMVCERAEI